METFSCCDWCVEPPKNLTAETTDDELITLANAELFLMNEQGFEPDNSDGTMFEILDGWRDLMRNEPEWIGFEKKNV
jgi:hypothetical protein